MDEDARTWRGRCGQGELDHHLPDQGGEKLYCSKPEGEIVSNFLDYKAGSWVERQRVEMRSSLSGGVRGWALSAGFRPGALSRRVHLPRGLHGASEPRDLTTDGGTH